MKGTTLKKKLSVLSPPYGREKAEVWMRQLFHAIIRNLTVTPDADAGEIVEEIEYSPELMIQVTMVVFSHDESR